MLTARQMITLSSVIFIKNILINKIPQSNYNLYNHNINSNIKIKPKYKPKSKKLKSHIVHKGIEMINLLPDTINNLPISRFKRRAREYIRTNNLWDPGDPMSEAE